MPHHPGEASAIGDDGGGLGARDDGEGEEGGEEAEAERHLPSVRRFGGVTPGGGAPRLLYEVHHENSFDMQGCTNPGRLRPLQVLANSLRRAHCQVRFSMTASSIPSKYAALEIRMRRSSSE